MASKLLVIKRCPLCGDEVEQVPDGELRKNHSEYNTEMVITRTGMKQYIHGNCWSDMIREGRPYDGKLYL